jgi:hypothetical protein
MSPPLSECRRTSLFRPRASLLRVTSISQSNPANVPASDCRSGAFLRCCSTAKERASITLSACGISAGTGATCGQPRSDGYGREANDGSTAAPFGRRRRERCRCERCSRAPARCRKQQRRFTAFRNRVANTTRVGRVLDNHMVFSGARISPRGTAGHSPCPLAPIRLANGLA